MVLRRIVTTIDYSSLLGREINNCTHRKFTVPQVSAHVMDIENKRQAECEKMFFPSAKGKVLGRTGAYRLKVDNFQCELVE